MNKTAAKKSATKKSVTKSNKKIKSPAIVNHLQPIDDILDFIELHEIKLKLLLESIPAKLEKLVVATKDKVSKTLVKHQKASSTLRNLQDKHSAKPTKVGQAEIKKAEKSLDQITTLVESIKEGHNALQEQLDTCKSMKDYLALTQKSTKDRIATKTKPQSKIKTNKTTAKMKSKNTSIKYFL